MNIILLKRKTTTGAPSPASLQTGEACYVLPDKTLYIKNDDGTVTLLNQPASGVVITTIEKDLGYPAKSSGNFLITGLTGLTTNKQVVISQAAGTYTNKGDDELEFDALVCSGIVVDSTTIKVSYNSRFPIGGNFKFNYFIQ